MRKTVMVCVGGILFFGGMLHRLNAAPLKMSKAEKRLCDGRSPCHMVKKTKPVQGEGNCKLSLIYLVLDQPDAPWGRPWIFKPCVPYEIWLETRSKTGAPLHRLLASVCNDGYGSKGIGEDIARIEDGLVHFSRHGGSAWVWSHRRTWGVSPFRTIRQSVEGQWTLGPNREERGWNWETFGGAVRWYAPDCERYEKEDFNRAPVADKDLFHYRYIPAVTMSNVYLDSRWQTTELGKCSVSIDAKTGGKFMLQGHSSSPQDGGLSVLSVGPETFLIEIRDDRLSAPSREWMSEDHLEIWTGTLPGYSSSCVEAGDTARQWGVRLRDGAVFRGHGNPKQMPKVGFYRVSEQRVRLKLTVPNAKAGVSFVFSDVDDGQTIERRLATSQVKKGRASTLGQTFSVTPKKAVCEVKDGRLTIRRTEKRARWRKAFTFD